MKRCFRPKADSLRLAAIDQCPADVIGQRITDALDMYSLTVYIWGSTHSSIRWRYVSSEQGYRPSFQSEGY